MKFLYYNISYNSFRRFGRDRQVSGYNNQCGHWSHSSRFVASYDIFLLISWTSIQFSNLLIQGRGSYEDRTEMLRLIVDLVEASIYADNPDWRLSPALTHLLFLCSYPKVCFLFIFYICDFCSVDEQVTKDIQLIDSIAEKQAQIFSEDCKLFPADVQIQSIYPL